jgi:hypothetical protein
LEDCIVNDEIPLVPHVYEGLDPVPEPRSALAEVFDAVRGGVNKVTDAIEATRSRECL